MRKAYILRVTSDSQTIALAAAHAASDKKAENIRVLDLRQISSFADFFVICSGTSDPHLKAIGASGDLSRFLGLLALLTLLALLGL